MDLEQIDNEIEIIKTALIDQSVDAEVIDDLMELVEAKTRMLKNKGE